MTSWIYADQAYATVTKNREKLAEEYEKRNINTIEKIMESIQVELDGNKINGRYVEIYLDQDEVEEVCFVFEVLYGYNVKTKFISSGKLEDSKYRATISWATEKFEPI